MEKKYQIFISSTYNDLIEERRKTQDAILSMEHFPIGMEYFSAASEHQWSIIKRSIDSSDYYVLIIGYRYGTELPNGISYTEREYDYASAKGIPILVFLKREGLPTIRDNMELDSKKQQKLKYFINKAMDGREVSWWSTKEELGQIVTNALYKEFNRNERTGWTRVQACDEKEIEKLKKENARLRNEIEILKNKSKRTASGLFISNDNILLQNHGDNPCTKVSEMHVNDYFNKGNEK